MCMRGVASTSRGCKQRARSVVSVVPSTVQAKCGDKLGAAGDGAVTDGDCGSGYLYNANAAETFCGGAACNVAGVEQDKAACCIGKCT